MNTKDIFCRTVKKLQGGFVRFAPFENSRYFVALTENLVTNRYDVTLHVNKLMGNSGAAADWSDGFYHSHNLKEEDALWELTPDIRILVKYITLYHPPEEKDPGYLNCYIFRK